MKLQMRRLKFNIQEQHHSCKENLSFQQYSKKHSSEFSPFSLCYSYAETIVDLL